MMGLGGVFKKIGSGVKAVVTAPTAVVETGKRVVIVKVIMGIVRHLLTSAGGAVAKAMDAEWSALAGKM